MIFHNLDTATHYCSQSQSNSYAIKDNKKGNEQDNEKDNEKRQQTGQRDEITHATVRRDNEAVRQDNDAAKQDNE